MLTRVRERFAAADLNQDGKVTTVGEMSAEDVEKVKTETAK